MELVLFDVIGTDVHSQVIIIDVEHYYFSEAGIKINIHKNENVVQIGSNNHACIQSRKSASRQPKICTMKHRRKAVQIKGTHSVHYSIMVP